MQSFENLCFVKPLDQASGRTMHNDNNNNNDNSVALVRERTVPTERPPFVGEVSASFGEKKSVAW
jgi:hypothetical protein